MVKVPDQKFVDCGNSSTRKPFVRGNQLNAADFFLRLRAGRGSRPGMVRAERYRRYAAECVRLARKADTPAEKDLLLQMAEHWRRLAQRAEKDEAKRPRSTSS